MNDILGYTPEKSSYELYKHGKFLEEKVPQKYKKEMDCIYDWVKTREFCSAMDNNTKESWSWLKSSMVHPPLQIIHKYEKETEKRNVIEAPKLISREPQVPQCRLCKDKLANNIIEKIKFSMIICKCDMLWTHNNCAEEYVLKYPKCTICKEYFILSPCCSSIQSKLVDLMNQK